MIKSETKIPFRLILDSMEGGVVVQDESGQVIYANDRAVKILGFKMPKELVGQSQDVLMPYHEILDEHGDPLPVMHLPGDVALKKQATAGTTFKLKDKVTLREKWVSVDADPVRDEEGGFSLAINIIRDITKRKKIEEQNNFYATHDELTGLANRKFFSDNLEAAIKRSRDRSNKLVVLFIDMDRLKDVNDTLGHEIGDVVLKEAATRFHKVLGNRGIIARWGGDEFVVMINDVQDLQGMRNIAHQLLAVTALPVLINSHSLHVNASIGGAVFPEDGQDVHTLLKNADTALYRSKEAGRNRLEFYHYAMSSGAAERLALENELRQALKKNEFELYFQPIVDLKTRNIVSVEALVRWNHPRLGFLKPGKFIDLVENIGLAGSLDKWVLENACDKLKIWQQNGISPNIAVNFSAKQFIDESLLNEVLGILERGACNPKFLEIEVTESAAMDDLEKTERILKQLAEHDICIVLDDFGTGYSSLSYVKRFPIHKLKIDRGFVYQMLSSEQDNSIIKAIISLAKSLKLKVVAEGVDTKERIENLAALGCDEAQGDYISPPLAARDLLKWMEKNASKKH